VLKNDEPVGAWITGFESWSFTS